MTKLKVEIEACVERDIRSYLKSWPKRLLVGAGLAISAGLVPALSGTVIAMLKEWFSPAVIGATTASTLFIAGLASIIFGRTGSVLVPARVRMMELAHKIASTVWVACFYAVPIYLGVAVALLAASQWRSAAILGYFCCVLAVLGAVPRICIYFLEVVPPSSAGALLRNGRLQGLFLVSSSLLILRELIVNLP